MSENGRTALVARVLLGLFAVALAYTVLLPSDGHEVLGLVQRLSRFAAGFGLPFRPVFAVVEFTANIALFVPLGVLVPLAMRWAGRRAVILTTALGAAISIAIELTQLLIPGRVASALDVLANTLGALCGALIVAGARRRTAGARAAT